MLVAMSRIFMRNILEALAKRSKSPYNQEHTADCVEKLGTTEDLSGEGAE